MKKQGFERVTVVYRKEDSTLVIDVADQDTSCTVTLTGKPPMVGCAIKATIMRHVENFLNQAHQGYGGGEQPMTAAMPGMMPPSPGRSI